MGRLNLKDRQKQQAKIREKRAANAEKRKKEREERLANRPLTGRMKLSQQRAQRRKAQAENKNQKSNKSKLKMGSIERENRKTFGDKEVDRLKARHKAWKEARRKKKK